MKTCCESLDLTNGKPSPPRNSDPQMPLLRVPPRRVRWPARLIAYAVVLITEFAARLTDALARLIGPRRLPPGPVRILLTGTFHSDNWLHAHLRPLAANAECRRVTVVSDHPMGSVPKVKYACPPTWLRRIVGRTVARSMTYIFVALRERPEICGGFHLLCNGMLALFTARLLGAQALYFCVGGKTEVVGGGVYCENGIFGKIGRHDSRLERMLLRVIGHIDAVVTMGHGAKRFFEASGVKTAIHVNPGGIGAPPAATETYQKDIDLIVTCRLAPVKRLDVFLWIVRTVADRRPGLRAAIVGGGREERMLHELAAQLRLDGILELPGQQVDVRPWLRRARLFMLTSDSEGVPLSIMEALQMGVPCIASDVGDIADMVHNGENGYRVPRRDVEAFAQRVLALLDDPELLATLAENGRRTADGYTLESTLEKWTPVLAGLRNGHVSASRASGAIS